MLVQQIKGVERDHGGWDNNLSDKVITLELSFCAGADT